ncbi:MULTISPECIES: multidrug effflux MFS transporter [unclassified Acinetobacter]|uniref:multidrug effflux MFS transporter n=1 Tax=unclassified Acinetobacter TaxID=196816 RepID=UPI002934FC6B|nr:MULTISPECIES: multidrug effflux MFS transporter [unclassified Acinetobacter]WOE32896.1 multidrug effflux MFS transporter [Acinetobacter sp. SAAs470]WOE38373.1 multidrug effflux MFS transporter [Acinetobacter sp. SAAs474]
MTKDMEQSQYSTAWIILLALFTSLGPLSIDMYLPALPDMAQDFGVSTQQIANTLPAYFLGLAIGQLFYGPISDRLGRKKPLYFGMMLYTVASLLCVFAPNDWALIAARILQALGGCVGVVIARAAIRDKLDMQAAAQAFASMMIVMGLAPILAPMLGALILNIFQWRDIFIFLSAVGIFCLLSVHFFFTETLPAERRLKLNFKQVLALYAAILKDKSFLNPMLAGSLTGAALFCYISSAAAVFMDQFHMPKQQFAYIFGFNAFGIMLLSSLNKRLANHFNVKQRLKIGGYIQASGAIMVFIVGYFSSLPFTLLMIGLFMTVAGIGFTGPNAMALAMSQQGARAGTASAIMGSAQFACGLLGGVILNFLHGTPLLNMGLLMMIFTLCGLVTIIKLTSFEPNIA